MAEAPEANNEANLGKQEPKAGENSVSLDEAKKLVKGPEIFRRPPDQQRAIWDSLASHYGLTQQPSKPDESISTISLREGIFKDGIRAAVKLEDLGINPFDAINEFHSHQWKDELGPFVARLGSLGEPLAFDSALASLERYSFSKFASDVESTVRYKKAYDLKVEAERERERILKMTPSEWDDYRKGLRWDREGRANEVYQETVKGLERDLKNPFKDTAAPYRDVVMVNYFLNLQTTKVLAEHTTYSGGVLIPQVNAGTPVSK